MKVRCPDCGSDSLDEGINGKILCHGCKTFWTMTKSGKLEIFKE